jgi:hypothetical protein
MDNQELYSFLGTKFRRVIEDGSLENETVEVTSDGGTASAVFRGRTGQAESRLAVSFRGTLKEVSEMDLNDDVSRVVFVAVVNAVMGALGLTTRTSHCPDREPEFCAEIIADYMKGNYGKPKIALIGSQKEIRKCLEKDFEVRASECTSPDSAEARDAVGWADVVLCTGSVICDGTLCGYLNLDKEVIFYGTDLAGTAEWLGVTRLCF